MPVFMEYSSVSRRRSNCELPLSNSAAGPTSIEECFRFFSRARCRFLPAYVAKTVAAYHFYDLGSFLPPTLIRANPVGIIGIEDFKKRDL